MFTRTCKNPLCVAEFTTSDPRREYCTKTCQTRAMTRRANQRQRAKLAQLDQHTLSLIEEMGGDKDAIVRQAVKVAYALWRKGKLNVG